MVAENLTKTMGVHNTFVLLNTSDAVILQDTARIQALFPDLNFGIKYIAVEDDLSQLPAADIAICSSWPTAYILAKFNRCTAKFYFMQDYETLFYPAGSLSGMIDQTYRFGFYCIANSPGIYNKYLNFSKNAEYFIPGVDAAIFNSHKAERRIGPPWQVVHYGRPRNQRNAFALGLEALWEVKAHFGDSVRILSAGAVWNPKMYGFEGVIENLGILDDINAVADLYRSSHVGVVSMLTPHPSYQPLEYMACGCATVTNQNDGTNWLFKDHENAIVTSIVPSDIARGVITALEDEALWKRIVDGGAKTAASLNWEDAFSKIRNYIVAPNGSI
jgi:glycosyltransferase involved in cell wall biosynthesis